MATIRQPALFISHGGGPCFSMEFPGKPFERLRLYLNDLLASLPARPAAVIIISGHWEEDITTVGTAAAPGMIYDYYGFPPHTYQLSYPASGAPRLGRRVLEMLTQAGVAAKADDVRGYDHGVFVPMMVIDPDASISIVTLSLRRDLDPAIHLKVGRPLARLRDENILIIGSGNSFHNMRTMMDGEEAGSAEFDAWLTEVVVGGNAVGRDHALIDWEYAPYARACHPRAEHLLPLMVAAGAGDTDGGRLEFHDLVLGKHISGYRFG